MNEHREHALNDTQQTASLLLEAQQALTEARQITDDPAVLVCLLRVEHCLLRIGLLRQGPPPIQDSNDSNS